MVLFRVWAMGQGRGGEEGKNIYILYFSSDLSLDRTLDSTRQDLVLTKRWYWFLSQIFYFKVSFEVYVVRKRFIYIPDNRNTPSGALTGAGALQHKALLLIFESFVLWHDSGSGSKWVVKGRGRRGERRRSTFVSCMPRFFYFQTGFLILLELGNKRHCLQSLGFVFHQYIESGSSWGQTEMELVISFFTEEYSVGLCTL